MRTRDVNGNGLPAIEQVRKVVRGTIRGELAVKRQPEPDDSEPEAFEQASVSTASIREMILGSWQLAIVVVDLEQRYKYANSNGKELLERAAVFRIRRGLVVCADASLDAELSARIAVTASKNGLGDDGIVGWSLGPLDDPAQRMMVRFNALVSPKRAKPLVELRIARAESDFVPPRRLIAHSLGLTKTQASVAAEIARGHTVAKIAEELGIRPETVKDHLKSIYQRLHIDGSRQRGVDAKSLLIRRILALGY
jgi:DNA-binding CsgD family transcriptional regulator